MLQWQQNHIERNLPELLKTTRSDTELRARLLGRRVISEEEVDKLTRLGVNQGRNSEIYELFVIFKTRRSGYQALLQVLQETRQTGAIDVLRNLQGDVGEDVIAELLKLPVQLFGTIANVETTFGVKAHSALKLLQCPEVQLEISENPAILNLDLELPTHRSIYIPRTVSNRLLLDPRVFQINCQDVFVFKNIDVQALKGLVSPYATRHSSSQLSKITCRHIYLEDDKDWDDLVLVAKSNPLHLVCHEGGQYVLQQSTAVTSVLREHNLNKNRTAEVYITEDQFVDLFLSKRDSNSKGALLCDIPGMGKTLLMISIARKLQDKRMDHKLLVFFIELATFGKYLGDSRTQMENGEALKFILKFACSSSLAAGLLQEHSKEIGLRIVFVMDGFDEVIPPLVEKTTTFLKTLNEHENVRLLISSRPHMRLHLEQTFSLISYDCLPFGREEQVNAMEGIWRQTIRHGNEQELKQFALKCIQSFRVIRHEYGNSILGVPLRCYLLAVVNEQNASQLSKPNRHKPFVVEEIAIFDSIAQLYENFVDSIVAKALKASGTGSTDLKQAIANFHTHKALDLLFPEIGAAYLTIDEVMTSSVLRGATAAGLLFLDRDSKLSFLHRSFAEYFAAKFFAEFWLDVEASSPAFVQTVGVYFMEMVLGIVSTAFKNWTEKIQQRDILRVFSGKFTQFSYSNVLWFMNSICGNRLDRPNGPHVFRKIMQSIRSELPVWRRITLSLSGYDNSFTRCRKHLEKHSYLTLMACVEERLPYIMSLFVQLLKSFFGEGDYAQLLNPPQITWFQRKLYPLECERYVWLLLCQIAVSGYPETAADLFSLFGGVEWKMLSTFNASLPPNTMSPLDIAIHRNDKDMVAHFIDKITVPWDDLFKTCMWGNEFTEKEIDARIWIMETVLGSESEILAYLQNNDLRKCIETPGYYEYGMNVKVLTRYAWKRKMCLNAVNNENKRFLLNLGLKQNDDEEIEKLILMLFSDNGGVQEYTVDELLESLDIECARSAFQFHAVTMPNTNYLMHIKDVKTLQLLLRICPDFSECVKSKKNYLHFAVRYGRLGWVEYLLHTSKHDVNQPDENGNTPLLSVRLETPVEVLILLVENEANIYAKNKWGENIAYILLRDWIRIDLQTITDFMKYTLQEGYVELWNIPDKNGKTPLELVHQRAQSTHPEALSIVAICLFGILPYAS